MDRRRFVLAAMSLPWLANVASGTASEQSPGWLYDERFAQARALAMARCRGREPVPVAGDVTDHWRNLLRPALVSGNLKLSGVTTESFAFCLGVMARDAAGPRARVRFSQFRHDADLRIWELEVFRDG